MIFPITYIMVILWFIFISYENENYWVRFEGKLFGILLGIILAIKSIAGEQWLAIDSSNVLSLQTFNDGFALPLSLFVLGMSIMMIYILAMSVIDGDYAKEYASGRGEAGSQ
jgi:hypothetical protein